MPLDQVDVDKIGAPEKEMSFLDHLEELRWHLVRSISAVVVFAIIVFASGSKFFEYVIFAPMKPEFPTYRLLCSISEFVCMQPPELELISVIFGGEFIVHLKVSLQVGLIMAFPYFFWEIWKFVKPALYEKEQKVTKGVVLVSSGLFLTGVLFGYYVIAPFAITFLGSYDVGATNSPSLTSYVSYLTMFTIPTGIVFQMPLVIFFLSKLGIVTPELLRTYRKHAFVLLLILSAIITPPDAITQLLICFPLYGLYEISIRVSARVQKNQMKKELQKVDA
ncbi:MAG: twin-arginine translocase subunit TatC [Saprospiraceae bacterium]|nr:twin-arginine translocase subunit TatC [Saprospiraceae bacterium]